MAGVFTIDDIDFTHAVVNKVKRSFTILDGENAGRQLVTAKMERDVLGTFYNYDVEIDSSFMTASEYATLYDLVSAPTDYHRVELPYNNETLVFNAYVSKGSDELTHMDDNGNIWHSLSISFVAMEPQRK